MTDRIQKGEGSDTAGRIPASTSLFAVCPLRNSWHRASHAVRRTAGAIITMVAFTAAAPVQAQPTPEDWSADTTKTVRIMLQQQQMPKITLAASRDTIFGGVEPLTLTLTREAPLDAALTVTVRLTQEQDWLSNTSFQVEFAADGSASNLALPASLFAVDVTESGTVTATIDSVTGYDTDEAMASIYVVSRDGPFVEVSLTHSSYTFEEDDDGTDVIVTARMAAGMPRGVSFRVSVSSRGNSFTRPDLTAGSPGDYAILNVVPNLREEDYALRDDRWVARHRVPVALLDDEVREGREKFELLLARSGDFVRKVGLLSSDTSVCMTSVCPYPVFIDDDEDIPALELSVSPEEISEEEETSSTATVSITNGKTFAANQTVTFAFAGTAIEGTDYTVAPADGDDVASDHQTTMLADSTSVDVTLTAVDDDFEDGNETIEISATHDGNAVGSTQTIRILNQDVMPKITLTASRDTIIAGLEALVLTATREAPLDDPLAVTLQVSQDRSWLARTSFQLNFAAGGSVANLNLSRAVFSSDVTQSGTLTATIDAVSGYDAGDATATVHVVSQAGPAIKVSFAEASYRFAEDQEDPSVAFVVRAAVGMPRGASVNFTASARGGTAGSPGDYQAISETVNLSEADFALKGGVWEARPRLPLTLVDDDVFEGTESFALILEMTPGLPSEVQFSDLQGNPCQDDCRTPVEITDDEDIPAFALSVSPQEILEEGETSSIATLTITNGKTFADDRMLTFQLGGDAIAGHDYSVAPADADGGAGHQVILPAGSSSVELTFTAIDDEREEGDEMITLRVSHDGSEVGSATIRLVDRFPGPRVEITFEGVQAPRDEYTAGVATGPFTTRITFSEPVVGFAEEDIEWSTHSLTTIDTTSIGVLMWDYTVVREGLEYTAKMMPDQDGRLWIVVRPGAATSLATGDGNQFGANSLWVDLPPNRLMVVPRELTVDEGDADGAVFMVVPTSPPTGDVTVMVTGTDGTDLNVDWSTWTFGLPYWNGGWGVRVTAAHDPDAANERVRLWVKASGGGYDGRGGDLTVNIRDDDGASGDRSREHEPEQDEVAEALTLLAGVTPAAAAAALFGEHDLDEPRLEALDLLGNGNGGYDLGDLLSWIERCRSGEADCEERSLPDSSPLPGAVAGMAAGAARGRRSRHGDQSRRAGRRTVRYGLPLLLAAVVGWACTDEVMQPPREPDPGYLTVELATPANAHDIGAMLVVEGPGIEAMRTAELELIQSDASSPTRTQIIVSGQLSSGPLLEIRVPDRGRLAEYRVQLLQVVGADYALRDLARYAIAVLP